MYIAYKGVTIADSTANTNQLIGWSWSPAVFAESVIDKKAPLGIGFWSKSDGYETIEHSLDLQVKVQSVEHFMGVLKNLATISRGSLVIPTYGTYTNCRLSGIAPLQISPTDDGRYIVQTTLSYTQYPTV